MKIFATIGLLIAGCLQASAQTLFVPSGSVMFSTNGGVLFMVPSPTPPPPNIVYPNNIQFVQASAPETQSKATSFGGVNTVAGDTIICPYAEGTQNGADALASAVSDTQGNTWVLLTNYEATVGGNPNFVGMGVWAAFNIVGGPDTITFTASPASGLFNVTGPAVELSGVYTNDLCVAAPQVSSTVTLPITSQFTNDAFLAFSYGADSGTASTAQLGSTNWSNQTGSASAGGFSTTIGTWLNSGGGYAPASYSAVITPSGTLNLGIILGLMGKPYITNYFVDNAGSDTNLGNLTSPFKTLGHALTNAQAGTPAFHTMIYLSTNGTAETFTNDYLTGVNSFVTITSYGSPCIISNTASTNVLQYYGCSGILVSNVIVRGWAFNNTNIYADIAFFAGLTSQASNTSVVNCDLSLADYGINRFVSTAANPGCFSGKYDSGNNIHDIVYYGAKTWYSGVGIGTVLATNPMTLNTTFSNILGVPIATQGEAGSGTGECIYGPVGWLASNCVVTHLGYNQGNTNSGGGQQGCAGLFNYSGGWGNHYIKITGYDIKATTNGGDGAVVDLDQDSLSNIVEQCFCHDTGGPGIESDLWNSGNRVCWNVIINCGTNAINSGALRFNGENTSGTNYIYNNTVNSPNTLSVVSSGTNNVFANNILQGNGMNVGATWANCTYFNGNNYPTTQAISWGSGNYTTTATWTNGTLQDIGCNIGSVSFSGVGTPPANFQLNAASPLVAAGKDVNFLYGIPPGTLDYDGGTVLSSGNNIGGLTGSH